MFITSLIISLLVNWKLGLVLLILFPVLVILGYFIQKEIEEGSEKSSKDYEKAGGIAEEILYNFKTVSSFFNYKFEINRYNSVLKNALSSGTQRALRTGFFIGILYFILHLTYVVAIWLSSNLIINYDKSNISGRTILPGDVIVVLNSIIMSALFLTEGIPNLKAVLEACVAAHDFYELRNRNPQIFKSNYSSKPDLEEIKGKIVFDNVSFSYQSNSEILNGFNLTINENQTTAIVGASGSGKTTIISLILRFYDSYTGDIYLDNYNIKHLDLEYFRSLIGYVLQEPILFNKSIRENILIGRENISESQIKKACELACLNEFVELLPDGLDTVVGVKGSEFSGGQKQRIAIARAILNNPKILILDEATSALDNKSEKEVQAAINSVSKNITTIVIAHRLSTIMNADNILVLQKGKLIESGDHKSLLEKEGYYASLIKDKLPFDEHLDSSELNESGFNDKNKPLFINDSHNFTKSSIMKNSYIDNSAEIKLNRTKFSYIEDIEEDEELDSKNREKIYQIIYKKKSLLITAIISSAFVGIAWPLLGMLIGVFTDALAQIDKSQILYEGKKNALFFLVFAVILGLCMFFQR